MLPKLSDIELEALAGLQHDPNIGAVALARRLNKKTHVVQHALQTLKSKGFLKSAPVIDTISLGFIDFIFLLSVTDRFRAQFKKHLRQKKRVRWFAELGDGGFYVVVSGRTIQEAAMLIDELSERANFRLFSKNNMAILLRHHCLERGYLYGKKHTSNVITCGGSSGTIELDAVDLAIIRILRLKAGEADASLAKGLKLSQTTFSYRARRLEKIGVIRGYMNRVSAEALGMQSFKLMVTTIHSTQECREHLLAWARAQSNVTLVREILGAWDFEVSVEVRKQKDVLSIRDSLLESFSGHIDEVRVLSILEEFSQREPPL